MTIKANNSLFDVIKFKERPTIVVIFSWTCRKLYSCTVLMFGRWMDVLLYPELALNLVLSNPSNPGLKIGCPERLMLPCKFQMLPVKIMRFGMTGWQAGMKGMEIGRKGLLLQNLCKRGIQDSSLIKPDQVLPLRSSSKSSPFILLNLR